MSPLDALRQAAATFPNRTAFVANGAIWTNRRFVAEVERLARAMAARGVGPGDRVALHMANLPEMAMACYACFRLGAIASPLNNRFKTLELRSLLQRLQPRLYLGQSDLYPLACPIESEILPLSARFVVGAARASSVQSWNQIYDGGEAPPLKVGEAAPDGPVLLLTTSGTTGQPKFVAHTLTTLGAVAEGFHRYGLTPGDVIVNSCPMVHASGLFSFIAAVHYNTPMVLIERFDPDAVLDAIETHHVTWMLGLPFMYSMLLERQRTHPRRIESLRFCVSAGDVCPEALQLEFPFAFGRPLHSIWAMTEVAGNLGFGDRPGPVIRVPSDAEVQLVDDDGRPVPRGMPGELYVRDPGLARGYWSGPNQIEPCDSEGWLATGDIMRQGNGNELWFVSRKKDLIVRGGSNIAPAEVERVLKGHPCVRDAAVIGMPDPILGERVAALLELTEEASDALFEDILARSRPQLADYKLPEQMLSIPQIPRNALGKIDRKALPMLLTAS